MTVQAPVKVYLPVATPDMIDDSLDNIKITRGKITGLKREFLKNFYFYSPEEFYFGFPQIHPVGDGMFSAIKLLEMLACKNIKILDIIASLPQYYFNHNVINCPLEKKGFFMRKMSEEAIDKTASFLDGIKIFIDKER